MKTIKTWITREPEGGFEDEYTLHFEQPELKCWDGEEEHNGIPYWHSNDNVAYLAPQESYGLNYGECKEWVMVESTEFEKMKEKIEEQGRLLLEIEEEKLRYEA